PGLPAGAGSVMMKIHRFGSLLIHAHETTNHRRCQTRLWLRCEPELRNELKTQFDEDGTTVTLPGNRGTPNGPYTLSELLNARGSLLCLRLPWLLARLNRILLLKQCSRLAEPVSDS